MIKGEIILLPHDIPGELFSLVNRTMGALSTPFFILSYPLFPVTRL